MRVVGFLGVVLALGCSQPPPTPRPAARPRPSLVKRFTTRLKQCRVSVFHHDKLRLEGMPSTARDEYRRAIGLVVQNLRTCLKKEPQPQKRWRRILGQPTCDRFADQLFKDRPCASLFNGLVGKGFLDQEEVHWD